jgi:hypothetical protein
MMICQIDPDPFASFIDLKQRQGREDATFVRASLLYFAIRRPKEPVDLLFQINHSETSTTAGKFFSPEAGDEAEADLKRLGFSILLMERNPELFEPDILAKDLPQYNSADAVGKQRLEDRAFRRRGQRGWHLGRKLETIPHYRRPHPALYWTGKGGKTPRVIFRSGAIVNREILTKVPTGRLDNAT